jgi:hypothetical protein
VTVPAGLLIQMVGVAVGVVVGTGLGVLGLFFIFMSFYLIL